MKDQQVKAGQVWMSNGGRRTVRHVIGVRAWVASMYDEWVAEFDYILANWTLVTNSDGTPAEESQWREMKPWEIVTRQTHADNARCVYCAPSDAWIGKTAAEALAMCAPCNRVELYLPASTPIPPDPGPGYKLLHPAVNTTADYQNAQWWYLGAWVDREPCDDIIEGVDYRKPVAKPKTERQLAMEALEAALARLKAAQEA